MSNLHPVFERIFEDAYRPKHVKVERKMPAKRFAVTLLDEKGKQYVVVTTGLEGYTTACDVEKIMIGCTKIGVRQL